MAGNGPRVQLNTRVLASTVAEVRRLGDDVAARFGEGARPTDSEITRVLIGLALRQPAVQEAAKRVLTNSRLKKDV